MFMRVHIYTRMRVYMHWLSLIYFPLSSYRYRFYIIIDYVFLSLDIEKERKRKRHKKKKKKEEKTLDSTREESS